MKNILLPTDFSKNSLNAIDYALHFFENCECNFFILNVQKSSEYISDDLVSGSKSESIYESIALDNKKSLDRLIDKLSKEYSSQAYEFKGIFDYDDIVSAVSQTVKNNDIELIIMGTNGASGTSEVIFGSNTLQVIRNIDCPTLTIPEGYRYTKIKKALFSTQNCEDIPFDKADVFKEMLDLHHCKLNVLMVNIHNSKTSDQENIDCLQKLFPEHPFEYFHLDSVPGLSAVNTATQLLKVELHAALIEKESFLKRLLVGSDNSTLLYRTLIPLLFLHR